MDMIDAIRYTSEEKIVISMDVGTTQSAISYMYLYPNTAPEIKMVTRWAGQPDAMGDSKIPTILAYQGGILVACGAEVREFIGDNGYEIARWFKLFLHTESMKSDSCPSTTYGSPYIDIPPLPTNTTLKQIYSDFLRYLFNSAKMFFEENTPNGRQIWNRLSGNMTIVLATPNGWDMTQQGFLRAAAIDAQIITPVNASCNLEFVTEGEASVHYVLAHQQHTWIKQGSTFVVVDAGGSTIDSTVYRCDALRPKMVLREVCPSECDQAGGVFIDHAARDYLKVKLAGSQFSDEESLDAMIEAFERGTKRLFDGTQESNVIQFGSSRDNDRARGIIRGRLSLSRVEVEGIFDIVLSQILDSITKLIKGRTVKYVVIVGGFGESPYLRNRFQTSFGGTHTEVVMVDHPSKKAAAEGASIWYIKQLVTSRVARFTIGMWFMNNYMPHLPEHYARQHLMRQSADGALRLLDAFDTWLEKGTDINQGYSHVSHYTLPFSYRPGPNDVGADSTQIYVWEGQGRSNWTHDMNGNLIPGMRKLCSLQVDGKVLAPLFREYLRADGQKYWNLNFRVAVRYDGRQMTAKMQWNNDNGQECEGPVTIIPGHAF